MWRRALRSSTIALVLFALAGLHAADPAKGDSGPPKKGSGGRITAEKDVVDVGAVVRGKVATATFVLKNTGTDELKILSAKPG